MLGRPPSLAVALALVVLAGGCGGDEREESAAEAAATPTATAASAVGIEEVVGVYRTTLTEADVPKGNFLPPEQVIGDWNVTIAATGGVDDGPSLQIVSEQDVRLLPGTPAVRDGHLVLVQQKCAEGGSFADHAYPIRRTGDELVLEPLTEDDCPPTDDDHIEVILTAHPLERVK